MPGDAVVMHVVCSCFNLALSALRLIWSRSAVAVLISSAATTGARVPPERQRVLRATPSRLPARVTPIDRNPSPATAGGLREPGVPSPPNAAQRPGYARFRRAAQRPRSGAGTRPPRQTFAGAPSAL